VVEPGILEAEVGRLGNGSRDGDDKGDVVRGDAHAGGEGGFGEVGAESIIDQSTIKASESWTLTFVTPGEGAVQERELQECEGVDSPVRLDLSAESAAIQQCFSHTTNQRTVFSSQ
jgi:hypothetical protein